MAKNQAAPPGEAARGLPSPVHVCAWAEPMNLRDIGIGSHLLTLWLEDGPRMDYQRGRRHWHTRPKKGRFDYYPPCVLDRVRAEGPGRVLALEISGDFLSNLAEHGEGECLLPPEPEHQFRDPRLENIVGRLHAGGAAEQLVLHAVSLLEERRLGAARPAPGAFTPRRRRLLQQYIDRHLAGDLELSSMADASGYSAGHFMRAFKMAFGASPHQYILERRIERAKETLAASDIGLSELAYQLGFSSHAHFSTAFRMRTGTTPHEFRRERGRRHFAAPAAAARCPA